MRYVDELLRNAVAEIRLWAERRAARRGRGSGAPGVAPARSPLVAGLTQPLDERVGRQRQARSSTDA